MMIQIIAIGKKHEAWIAEGIGRYEKRLKRPLDVLWLLLPHSSREGHAAREEESKRILEKVTTDDFVILLDERGKNITSPQFASLLETPLAYSKRVVVIIGGAYGVDETVHARADFVWSLSQLVFPHQLVRLILAEQLYRAQEIIAGHPYHHD